MQLINSINFSGIVGNTITNLEKMYGIQCEVFLPLQYDGRIQHGDIKYNDEPIVTRKLLITNYIQNVAPSAGFKSFDMREEELECYLPADDNLTIIQKRSLVILKTAHGEEKYVITHIEALQGDRQTFLLKWILTPSSIEIESDEEIEEAEEIEETQTELYAEEDASVDRLVFRMDNTPETPKSVNLEDIEKTDDKPNEIKVRVPDDVEIIL